jgi:hypothetical protein
MGMVASRYLVDEVQYDTGQKRGKMAKEPMVHDESLTWAPPPPFEWDEIPLPYSKKTYSKL